MKTRYGNKVYPLTAAQRLHFFYQQYCPKKQVLNIGTSVTIETEVNFEELKKAIYQAYDRCESMRLRFAKDKDGTCYQYVVKKEERDIEYVNFTGWKEEDAQNEMKKWTSVPFEKYDSPQNRIVMITTPDGYNGLYLLVDHMTMDAQSLIGFLKDIIELYCSSMYEGVNPPTATYSYLEQLKKDLAYEQGCKAQERDREFFHNLIETANPIYNDIDGVKRLMEVRREKKDDTLRAVKDVSESVDSNIAAFHLEAEPSRRLLEFCHEKWVSMVCLLMMGLRTYFQKLNGYDEVSIVTTVARRATVKEKKSGGTRIHCFPFCTSVSKDDTFIEGIYKIRDGQNRLFRHANFDPVEYYGYRSKYYGFKEGETFEPMSLTYQPMTLQEKGLTQLGDIKYKTQWYPNGAAAHRLYLTVMHRSTDNGLDFNFEHQTGAYSYEKLEYFYYYLCKILFKGIENKDLKVGDILNLV